MDNQPNLCSLCTTFSGRHQMTRQCCKIRYLAAVPKAQRQEKYQQVKQEDGPEAANALILLVNQELTRRREWLLSHPAASVTP